MHKVFSNEWNKMTVSQTMIGNLNVTITKQNTSSHVHQMRFFPHPGPFDLISGTDQIAIIHHHALRRFGQRGLEKSTGHIISLEMADLYHS